MKLHKTFTLIMTVLIAFTLFTCEYDDYPDPIWDEDDAGNATPVITSVSPANLAYEGITEVTITGTGFSAVPSQNQVTFNGFAASIDEAKSSATQIVLTTPVFITESKGEEYNSVDSVKILVAAQGAYVGATYDQVFKVERAVIKLGGFVGEAPAKNANAITSDGNRIFVTAEDKNIYVIDAAGERSVFGTTATTIINDLKMGPDSAVYFARGIPYVYRYDPAGGSAIRWHRVGSKIRCLDFDENQDIYCGGANDSLYWVDVDNEFNRGVAPAEDYSYVSIRVYDGYVYVVGTYTGGDATVSPTQALWRHEILAGQDTLGAREVVYDWSDWAYSDEQDIASMVVDENGLFYLGTSTGSGPAIVTLDPGTGTTGIFYDAVTAAPIEHMFMGEDNYIYAITVDADNTDEITTIPVRIAQGNNGAPYYGF